MDCFGALRPLGIINARHLSEQTNEENSTRGVFVILRSPWLRRKPRVRISDDINSFEMAETIRRRQRSGFKMRRI